MKVGFFTLGCKVNQYETQKIREIFEKNGYSVSNSDDVDVFIINSCTVTAESDRKTRQSVRKYRSIYKNAVIILTGCMPQAFPEDASVLYEADIVVGNTDYERLPLLVDEFLKTAERVVAISKHGKDESFSTGKISCFEERTRAFIKIEDGCERYCTYCIIPKARGVVRSKSISELKSEVEALAKRDYSEIVLVGINLSAYGKNSDVNLCDAVDAVCAVDGIKRVRLGSLEPDHISDEMLKRLSAQEKFCPQFHLSLQSGCDETLKRMNRHYDSAFYLDLVLRIRKIFKDAAITTDIMVGFAGETDEEFEKSLAFARQVGFAKSHIFAYSRRKGTFAYNMPNQVSNAIKAERSRQMINTTLECEHEFLDSQLGNTYDVLFETQQNGFAYGYTKNYTRVCVKSDDTLNNKILPVKLLSRDGEICIGVLN